MTQIGVSEEFELKIDGIGGYWSGRSGVFRGLSDEVNIGTAALIRMGEAKGKTVYIAFTQNGTQLGWMEPGEEIGRPEEQMLIKTMKEIQEENGEQETKRDDGDTYTWEPGEQN